MLLTSHFSSIIVFRATRKVPLEPFRYQRRRHELDIRATATWNQLPCFTVSNVPFKI